MLNGTRTKRAGAGRPIPGRQRGTVPPSSHHQVAYRKIKLAAASAIEAGADHYSAPLNGIAATGAPDAAPAGAPCAASAASRAPMLTVRSNGIATWMVVPLALASTSNRPPPC